MNEFINKLIIKESEYKNGWFAKVPSYNKRNSAFVLTGGVKDDILVNDRTTSNEIRVGKYTTLVEISTAPYTKEITFNAMSKESAFSFDVYVKAVIQVTDPISFYNYKNLDVDEYFKNMFFMDVNKITKQYSILEYEKLDEDLISQLSKYKNVEADTGFSYQISGVWAKPDEKAAIYVERQSKQFIEAEIEKNTEKLINVYKKDYETAIWKLVAEGKITQTEAHEKIQEWQMKNYNNYMKITKEMLENNIINETTARSGGEEVLRLFGYPNSINRIQDNNIEKNVDLDRFFDEGVEG